MVCLGACLFWFDCCVFVWYLAVVGVCVLLGFEFGFVCWFLGVLVFMVCLGAWLWCCLLADLGLVF